VDSCLRSLRDARVTPRPLRRSGLLCSSALAALAAFLLSPPAARALTMTVQMGTNPVNTYGDAALDCAPAGGGEACDGTGLSISGPTGGWTLSDWMLSVNPDPTVSNNFSFTNNTGSTQNYLITITQPAGGSFGPPSVIIGSVGGSVTDLNGDGATAASVGVDSIYNGLIDGSSVQTLLGPSYSSSAGAFGTAAIGPAAFGPTNVGVATTTDIAIALHFSLTAHDSVALTSVLNVEPVPEPATVGLVLAGLVGLTYGGRRRA
jgi:hypothetical protein